MRIKAILSLCLFTLATAVSADEFIKINTDQVGLVLRAADNGRLYQSYLGKRLANESDLQHLPKGNEAYLTHGMEDYFEPAIEVHHNDANPSLLLKYVSHTSKNVQPGVDETVITLQDDKYPVTVKLHYVAYAKENIIKTFTEISHQEKKPLKLERYASAMLHFSRPAYYLTEFSGDWIYEATMSTTPLNFGKKVLDTKLGARANMFTPPMFILSLDKESSENEGEVILGTLGWTGNFRFTFEVDNKKDLRVIAGINPYFSEYSLPKGETFRTPDFYFTYSDCGRGQASRNFHDWARKYQLKDGQEDRMTLLNNWEATYFDFSFDKLLAIARRGAEIGCELFVLDDGWFGKRDIDNCSLGDWVVNEKKIGGSLRHLAESIQELGMRFGLWFEPEMVSPDSDLYRAHPDWCLHVDGRERTEARHQLILDMGRREVQDYVLESVSAVLRSAPISYVKWDMNRNMMEGFSAALPPERRMESQHRYMLGLYRVLEEITSAFPEVLFESCSGGGGRFDCGMLCYMPQTWTSDDTDACERTRIQYGTSLIYPCSAMGAHVSAVPNHQTGRVTPFRTRCNVAMGGNFGFELDLSRLSEEDLAEAKNAVAMVKALRATMQQGEYTRLLNPFEGDGRAAWQFTDESRAVVCMYAPQRQPNPQPRRVRLAGLDAAATYADAAHGITASGAALMNLGLIFPEGRGDHDSWVYVLEKVRES